MSWQAVARKDFQDAIRSRWLWGLSFIFIAIFSLPTLLTLLFEEGAFSNADPQQATQMFVSPMTSIAAIFVPLIAIVMAYASITRERESGTLKLLLSLPHSRQDVVIGKVLGRSAVLTAPILLGAVVAALLLTVFDVPVHFTSYFLFVLLTAVLGLVFVGLAVGVSASVDSSLRSMIVNLVLFLFFTFRIPLFGSLWNKFAERFAGGLADAVNRVYDTLGMNTTIGGEGEFLMQLFIMLLNPTQAYKTLVDSIFYPSAFQARGALVSPLYAQPVENLLNDVTSIQFTDPFVLVYMLFWLFVPVAAGYIVFEEIDL